MLQEVKLKMKHTCLDKDSVLHRVSQTEEGFTLVRATAISYNSNIDRTISE